VLVTFTPKARADLDAYAAHLAADDEETGVAFLLAAANLARLLAAYPFLGRPRSFSNPIFAGMRSISLPGFPNHLVFYRPERETILILRILHGAMDLDTVFGSRKRRRRRR
jgi:toxin ParE1/3/4